MPEPRHPHRRRSAKLSISAASVLALLVLTGCFQNHEPPRQFVPGDPLYEQFTSGGDRIMIDHPDDGPILKLRQRRHLTRVYDADMLPVGQVRRVDDQIEQRSLDAQTRRTTRWLDEDTVVLDDAWRLERVGEVGWDLFDADGFLISLWRRDDDGQWTIRATDGDAPIYRIAADEDRRQVVDRSGAPYLTVSNEDWSDLKLLVLTIDDFAPLERYTLASWADHHL